MDQVNTDLQVSMVVLSKMEAQVVLLVGAILELAVNCPSKLFCIEQLVSQTSQPVFNSNDKI